VLLFVAPRIVGGEGISWVAGPGVARMADALALSQVEVGRVGGDILVSGKPAGPLAKPRKRG
jgi:diaminohydroxyphosphoribosylaminopyrimidine deaminase/5-amino-6-(5-phosphoribosylamino)uracil reductase